MSDGDNKKLRAALMKKALGYVTSEQVCEYSIGEDGEQILCKKKVTKKQVSPDLAALKLLLEQKGETNFAALSDEQLFAEREKILQQIKEEEDGD